MTDAHTHVVVRYPQTDPLAGYNPNYQAPRGKVVFSGSKKACDQYVERQNEASDAHDPGPSGRRPDLRVESNEDHYGSTPGGESTTFWAIPPATLGSPGHRDKGSKRHH